MEIQLNISNAILLLTAFIILAAALTYFIYFFKKNTNEFTAKQRLTVSTLRFVSIFFILFLLLSAIIERTVTKKEKPILLVGIDNSESIVSHSTNTKIVDQILREIEFELENKFKIEPLLFGDQIEKSRTPDYTHKKSNYSSFLDQIQKQYFNMNVGAMVLIGDGIYNEGQNPEQIISKIQTPVYTIGIGDTVVKTDQAITDITHNPNVFLDNSFPVEVEMQFTRFQQPLTQLSIYIDGKLVKNETLNIPQPDYYLRKLYNVHADKVGLRNVSVQLSPTTDEENLSNNRQNFVIEVHDNRKKVLFLSQGPHPDIGALSSTLQKQANFNITSEDIYFFDGDIHEYDLIVLNQLPSARTRTNDLFKDLKESKISTLTLIGPRTSIPDLNNLLAEFELKNTNLTEESFAYFNSDFALFTLPQNINTTAGVYPPLVTPYTEYKISNQYSVVAYQKIKGVEMSYPLIMAGEINNEYKSGIIFGEGIWRWRLHEFQNYGNQNSFNQLTVNLFNYLTLKQEREQFAVSYQRIVPEFSPIQIKAQVFNDIFEPVNDAEIHFVLNDTSLNQLHYIFDPANSGYKLNLGFLPAGKYSFEATTTVADKIFTKTGVFSVQEMNIEQQNLQANHKILQHIAKETGGLFLHSSNYSDIIKHLNNSETIKPKMHKESYIYELIDWKWFLLIIFGLACTEWFLRKFWGSY